jgi:hypothetical protein
MTGKPTLTEKVLNNTFSNMLTLDPSGTSKTGVFFFKNWAEYEIFTIEGKNAVEHAEKVESYIKSKDQLEVLV